MNANNLKCAEQFGFRPSYSTELVNLYFTYYTLKPKLIIILYLWTFILIYRYITSQHTPKKTWTNLNQRNNIILIYLTDRRQYVVYYDKGTSDIAVTKTGVPYVSVLGPLLLLVYIKWIFNSE